MTTPENLLPNVCSVKDRHGKTRYRFRKSGYKGGYLPGKPGSPEHLKRYAELLSGGPAEKSTVQPPRRVNPRSLDDLFTRWKKSPKWKKKAPQTQGKQSRVMGRFLDNQDKRGRRYGLRPVDKVTVGWLDNILGAMWEKPAAANELRKVLAQLMDHAIRMNWRSDNPVRLTDRYQEGEGFHDWTDQEIEQYRSAHPLGTMARLTMELALNTAARRCNVNKIERDHIQDGRILVDHAKRGNTTSVSMLPMTKAAIDALPATPIRFLVTTHFGKPFSDAGLGNRMRKWCDAANLPHCSIHGLRKAMSRILAESGATDAQGQAITGQKKNETFQYYRQKANREVLADAALSNLAPQELVQPSKKTGKSID